jgi:hydroxymethylbilane synthase
VPLRIGTRGSRLALTQAEEVAGRLAGVGVETELVPILTSGDRGASPKESPAGMKGLFVAEITEALYQGKVDLAAHSAKDLPSEDPPGVVVAAVPERAVPYDVLVRRGSDLPAKATVGTSSLRRRAQLLRSRPSVDVRDVRGNVDTRLRKLDEGEFDALVLAAAGLARLGLERKHADPIPVEEMVPAPGQGTLAVQAREGSPEAETVARIDDPGSHLSFETERLLAGMLGGGCRLPLGAYAEWRDEVIRLLAVVISVDGSELAWSQVEASTPDEAAGEAAEILRAGGAERILQGVQ